MPIGNRYLLLEAYDLLGRHLFGTKWQHDEYRLASELPPADELERKRHHLQREIDQNNHEINAGFAIEKQTSNAVIMGALVAEREKLATRNRTLADELRHLPEPTEGYRNQETKAKRHKATLDLLLSSLRRGEIDAILSNATMIAPADWQDPLAVRLWLEYSMVTLARRSYGGRRASVFLNRPEFDLWLSRVAPLTESATPLPLEIQCVNWIKVEAHKGPKAKSRDDYWVEAQERFPGLSHKAFGRAWNSAAPNHWKSKGRPKS